MTGPMQHLVLVGGGHAHVHVLASFGQRPMAGVQVTLVARDVPHALFRHAPGLRGGALQLRRLPHRPSRHCAREPARDLLHAEAVGLSRAGRLVLMRGQPPLAYDLLSLDVGSAPHLGAIAGSGRTRRAGQADRRLRQALACLC